MSKRKFGGLKSFFSKSDKLTQSEAVPDLGEEWPSDSDGDDRFDPSAVNRPPPLDQRTESQLRRACAIIVENLKPSGYDIEDTRMKNDMYVDDLSDQEEPPAAYKRPQSQSQMRASTGPSTWFEDSSDRNSGVPYSRESHYSAEKRKSGAATLAERESYHAAKRRSEHQRATHQLKAQQGDDAQYALEQAEEPIAPVASVRRASRVEMTSPPITQASDLPPVPALNDRTTSSTTTTSTQDAMSARSVPSASTAATTTYPTPASNSKRTSDPSKTEVQSADASAPAAGAWMKEEVDKRKEIESKARPANIETALPMDDEAQSRHPYYQASPVPTSEDLHSDVPLSPGLSDPLDSPQVRSHSSLSNSRVVIRPDTGHDREDPMEPEIPVSEVTTSPAPVRRIGSHGAELKPLSETGTALENDEQITTTGQQEPTREDDSLGVPPISPGTATFDRTMAQIRARMAATSLSSHPPEVSGPPQLDGNAVVASPPIRASANNSLPTSPAMRRDPGWPAPPNRYSSSMPWSSQIPAIPPLPNKHQLTQGITVKDFGKPQSERARRNKSVAPRAPVQTDIDAVGFDSFMNVVEKTNSSDKAPSPTSSSHYGSTNPSVISTRNPSVQISRASDGPVSSGHSIANSESTRPRSALSAISSAAANVGGAMPYSPPLTPTVEESSRSGPQYGPKSPPMPAVSAQTVGRYSSNLEQQDSSIVPTPTTPSFKIEGPRKMSAFDFLKDTRPPSKNGAKGNDFFRVEPHPDYANSNGLPSPSINATTNGHMSPPQAPKSIKSPRTFSLTSRTSSRTGTSNPQPNGYPSLPTSSASKQTSGLKTWLTRRRSKSLLGGGSPGASSLGLRSEAQQRQMQYIDRLANSKSVNAPMQNTGGFSYFNDEEEDDPLVCAAPVVAFGRGW